MRLREATIKYLGDAAGVIPDIEQGGLLATESTPKKATVLAWDGTRFQPADLLANATVTARDGGYRLTGISAMAEQMFGIGNAEVEIMVTARPGCKDCQ